jgi:hypothetical protein
MTAGALPLDWIQALQTASDRAVSAEARRARLVRRTSADLAPSVSIDQAYRESVEALLQASQEAARPNWDGYGGRPVSEATIAQALAFLDFLPSTLPQPEVSVHPDGELAFDWSFGPRRLLTVSISESGRLSYAALIGHSRQHGTEFLLDALPEPIALALRRLRSAE